MDRPLVLGRRQIIRASLLGAVTLPAWAKPRSATARQEDGPALEDYRFCTQLFLPNRAAPRADDRFGVIPAEVARGIVGPERGGAPQQPAVDPAAQQELAGELLGALVFRKKWPKNEFQVLKVRFLAAPADRVRQAIVDNAKLWEPVVGLRFDFVDAGESQIRISFERTGSWSYIGTDAIALAQDQATMNFGWFNEETDDEEFRRTTLHEFGHALGMIHEHQHPEGGIPWDYTKVIAYYMQTQGWTPQEVWQQVILPTDRTILQYGVYDPTSIMHYPIPKQLLTDATREVGWNTDLSDLDRLFMKYEYAA